MMQQAVDRSLGDQLTYRVIGLAQKVHRELGPGFKEATYQKALELELKNDGLEFCSQPQYKVFYAGCLCGEYQPDIVVEKQLILELKAISKLGSLERMQTVSYMKAANLPKALLLNFGSRSVEVRRFDNR